MTSTLSSVLIIFKVQNWQSTEKLTLKDLFSINT